MSDACVAPEDMERPRRLRVRTHDADRFTAAFGVSLVNKKTAGAPRAGRGCFLQGDVNYTAESGFIRSFT